MLDTTIRKSNSVRSFSITSTITSLSSVESSLGVVISNTIGVSIGRRLIRVSNGSSVDKGSSMDKRGVICRSGMANSNGLVSTNGRLNLRETLRIINLSDGGMGSSEESGQTDKDLHLLALSSCV